MLIEGEPGLIPGGAWWQCTFGALRISLDRSSLSLIEWGRLARVSSRRGRFTSERGSGCDRLGDWGSQVLRPS